MPFEDGKQPDKLRELAGALAAYTESAGGVSPFATAIEGFTILRSDREKQPSHRIFKPALCLTAQGAKWAVFGDKRYDYPAGQALVVSVEMPSRGTVSAASAAEPFLGIVIEFDLAILRDVAEALDARPDPEKAQGVFVTELDGPLLDCALRGVRLLGTPEAIPVLWPGIMRELCYRLLTGPGGGQVLRLAVANGHEQRVFEAIHLLRARFAEPVRIEQLARAARMSPATLHRQFKSVTQMTPLQYQKQLRLLEARRLMVSSNASVEGAAFQVGYESASQFSREYARMFGKPPRRDISAVRLPAA